MNLRISLFGQEVFAISTDAPTEDDEDLARDLSGGELGSSVLEVGSTDRYMGFTNGREDE